MFNSDGYWLAKIVLMVVRLMLCITLCYCVLFVLSVSANNEQQVFQQQQGSILRRFLIGCEQDGNRLLEIALEHNLDIWQITDSHIDIYFPTSSSVPIIDRPFTEWHISSSPQNGGSDFQSQGPWNLSSFTNSSYHNVYHPLEEIEQFMAELSRIFPEFVEVITFGRSAEQRDMLGMKISKMEYNLDEDSSHRSTSPLRPKRGVVIMGAQHAREWISVSTALYLAHGLAANSSEPFSLAQLLDTYDFYILPVVNPDGYRYTWGADRFWYKNRQVLSPNSKCVGIDMNRNWGYKWKGSFDTAVPMDPCHHWYPGTRPFQAPEVNNVANYIATLPNLEIFLDLRSYGQIISSPLSHSCKRIPKDAEDQLEAALGAAHTIAKVHGIPYTTGRLCSTLYRAPGNVVDWMYKQNAIKYTYAIHLRDTGTYGFSLPAEWIKPVGEETAKMVEYLAKFIINPGP